jgi:enamine deaminase RidA (YjgF/YER057c/UK114 family)
MNATTQPSADTSEPAGAYSPSRRLGPFFQISGQVPKQLAGTGIEDQTVETLTQVEALLVEQGLGWQDVLMVRVFLADDKYWDGMDAAYRRVVGQPYPPRTTVSAGLAPGMLVEIDALAVIA